MNITQLEAEDAGHTGSQQDSDLIRLFLDGDKDAFDLLVLRYRNKVVNLCYTYTGDYNDAVDYAQDVFIKVYTALDKFKGDSSFSTWLYRITVNTCKSNVTSFYHRFIRRKPKTLKEDNADQDDTPDTVPDPGNTPEQVIWSKQKEALIRKAICTLPVKQKEVVILRDIEGLSYDEISQITGLSPGTVKSKIFRGRQLLKDQLKGSLKS